MKSTKILATVTGLAALTLGAASWASPITLQYTGFVSPPAPSGNITSSSPAVSLSVRAGQFNFNVIADPDAAYWDSTVQGFCIDITNVLHTSNSPLPTYNLVSADSVLNATQLARLGQLYDNNAGLLGSSLNDAAFQLAIWEIVYETAPQLVLAGDGNFHSANFGGARAIAQQWLNAIDLGSLEQSSSWNFYALTPDYPRSNQTLLVARNVSVSEPGTLVLLIAGLGLAVAGHRRRRN